MTVYDNVFQNDVREAWAAKTWYSLLCLSESKKSSPFSLQRRIVFDQQQNHWNFQNFPVLVPPIYIEMLLGDHSPYQEVLRLLKQEW